MRVLGQAMGRLMARAGRWGVAAVVLSMTTVACASYPAEPRYSTRPMPVGAPGGTPGVRVVEAPTAPPPARDTPPPNVEFGTPAPRASIEGGSLDLPPATPPSDAGVIDYSGGAPLAPLPVSRVAGATYVVQPGDTLSGIARRFLTPIQVLIDMNDLGPRTGLGAGDRVILPDSAVDGGHDPYATGPSPTGVRVPGDGLPPPPPPPVSQPPAPPSASAGRTAALDWPVRGDILRRFGPVGMGERNNGINIGAPYGTTVRASADGRVGYVGSNLPGQGLTVLILHRDGWRTIYGHLGTALVSEGDDVRAGEEIGTVGNTAGDGRPSIHYEIWRMQGQEPVPQDPLTILPR